jgi:hypothetical protein
MRNRTIGALSILALAMDNDRDYRFAETKQNRVKTAPKTTLSKSDQGKRKQKNKTAKKARKQNRK